MNEAFKNFENQLVIILSTNLPTSFLNLPDPVIRSFELHNSSHRNFDKSTFKWSNCTKDNCQSENENEAIFTFRPALTFLEVGIALFFPKKPSSMHNVFWWRREAISNATAWHSIHNTSRIGDCGEIVNFWVGWVRPHKNRVAVWDSLLARAVAAAEQPSPLTTVIEKKAKHEQSHWIQAKSSGLNVSETDDWTKK